VKEQFSCELTPARFTEHKTAKNRLKTDFRSFTPRFDDIEQ